MIFEQITIGVLLTLLWCFLCIALVGFFIGRSSAA